MSIISTKDLLESGVHFGHQTRRWDPKMAKYIYTERNGIHIIDLQKTVELGERAYNAIRENSANGGTLLFVGTKKQAQEAIKEAALRCNQYYVTHRWLGGMLTNFTTIRRSVQRLKKLEKMEIDGTFEALTKKEVLTLQREKEKLEKVLGGIKNMTELPTMIFVIDPKREYIAVNEARRLHIPIVSVVDTNCDPQLIDFPIPGNDDAIRAINLFVNLVADAMVEGESLASRDLVEEGLLQGAEAEEDDEEVIVPDKSEAVKVLKESHIAAEYEDDIISNDHTITDESDDAEKEESEEDNTVKVAASTTPVKEEESASEDKKEDE